MLHSTNLNPNPSASSSSSSTPSLSLTPNANQPGPAPDPMANPAGPTLTPSVIPTTAAPAANDSWLPPDRPISSTSRTIDQMIEDTISKVTAQSYPYPPSTQPSLGFRPHSSHSQPFDFVPQAYALPQWPTQPLPTQPLGHLPDHPIPRPSQHSSSQPQQPAFSTSGPSHNALPADILHILESDFTSGAPDGPDEKAAQIRRVAEELRVKVRLSRYRRARDELSDSGEEDGATTVAGCSSESEEGEQMEADALDDADGSGDEEEALVKSNQALIKLKMEIEQIIGIPAEPTQPPIGPDTISPAQATPEAQENEAVMKSTDPVPLAPRSEELERDTKVDVVIEAAEASTAPAEPESPDKLASTKSIADTLPLRSQLASDAIIKDAVQIGSTAEAVLGPKDKDVVVLNYLGLVVEPEERGRDLPDSSFPERIETSATDSLLDHSASKQPEKPTGDAPVPSLCKQPQESVDKSVAGPASEQLKEPARDSLGPSPSQQPEQKTSPTLPLLSPPDQPEKSAPHDEPISSTDVSKSPAPNLLQVNEPGIVESTQADDDGAEPVRSANPRRRRKRAAKNRSQVEEESLETPSEDEGPLSDDDLGAECGGPTTANELKEPPAEATEVPFEKLSADELESIKPLGTVMAVIAAVLVIKGAVGLGYDKVLDEGSLVCFSDGLVIGKVFETFGSVTDPHYSIRLPVHLQSSAPSDGLSPGQPVFFVPSHSTFVFTSALKAQPKGTDASNLYDEELGQADEIEFSDDEAEAAYVRSCRLAKKAAAAARRAGGGSEARGRGEPARTAPVLVPDDGRRMLTKRVVGELNYDEDDGELGSTDYSLLERPKGGLDYGAAGPCAPASCSTPSGSAAAPATDQRGQSRRGRGARGAQRGASRGRGGRDRSRRTGPPHGAPALKSTGTPGKLQRDAHTAPVGPGPQPAFATGEPAGTFPMAGQVGFRAPGPAVGPFPVGGALPPGGGLPVGAMNGFGPFSFNPTMPLGGPGHVGYPAGMSYHHQQQQQAGPINFCYQPTGSNYHQQAHNHSLGIGGVMGFGHQVQQQQHQHQHQQGGGGAGGGAYNPRFFGH